MTVTVNGEPLELAGPASVRQLLELRGLDQAPCAVEVNEAVVPHREHAAVRLRDGDRIEIVTLVGGG